jgi:hypothetical protein
MTVRSKILIDVWVGKSMAEEKKICNEEINYSVRISY